MSDLVTYADAAQWLPTSVREAIEAAQPCPRGGAHQWHHDRTEITKFGQLEPVLIAEHWHCACGLVHTIDPNGAK